MWPNRWRPRRRKSIELRGDLLPKQDHDWSSQWRCLPFLCCWVHHGTEERDSLRTWISENCEEFREMQIVRHAKYVGTMIGPDGHFHRWTAPRKNSYNECWKSMLLPKVWLSGCVTSRFLRFLCWVLLDLFVHQTRQPSRPRTMHFSVPQQARTTLYRLHFLGLAPYVALFLIWWAFIPSASRLPIELLHARQRLAKDLRKLIRLVDTIALVFSLSLIWEKEFLVPSMALSTADAFDIVCRLDRNDTLDEVPQNKKQKIATGLLLDKLHKQDFAGPLSSRASRVLGLISRHRVADILPHMKIVSRASRPGLLVGFLRILCNGLCTAQRVHTEEHDHTCSVGCPNEPDPLTHYNECPRLYNIFDSFWRHAATLPQRNHLLHDLITRLFLLSLQYGIVVIGFLDALVYAHHKHRQGSENPGNFGDCMKGRIRFMTAITPAYAHA